MVAMIGREYGKIFQWAAVAVVVFSLMTRMSIAMPAVVDGAPQGIRPSETISGAPLPALRVTLYYTALETDYPRGTDAAFRDRLGRVLRTGSGAFVDAAAIEGSVRFDDGEVLNYDRRMGSEVRWMRTAAQYGLDARGCELVAYRSAAVDPGVVTPGTILLLEETRGMPLPDGSLHDGIWVAADTGEAILGQRIDLFTGAGMESMAVVRAFGIRHMQPLTARNIGLTKACTGRALATFLPKD